MSVTPGIRMKTPAHPGGFVKHEIIEPHGLSVTDAARILRVTCPALSALLPTKRPRMCIKAQAQQQPSRKRRLRPAGHLYIRPLASRL